MNRTGTTRADVARLIAMGEAQGHGPMTEMLRPVMRGELNLILPLRDTQMPPLRRMEKQGRPVVVLIGDDDYCSTGPDGWACAAKLRQWARFAIVHGTGAQRAHYAFGVAMALQERRLLFIETGSQAAQLWAGFLKERAPPLRFMGFLPPDGVHPVMPARGDLH